MEYFNKYLILSLQTTTSCIYRLLYQLGNTNIDCSIFCKQIIYNFYYKVKKRGRKQGAHQRVVAEANATTVVVEARGSQTYHREATANPAAALPFYKMIHMTAIFKFTVGKTKGSSQSE
jgi:hypothetical protein